MARNNDLVFSSERIESREKHKRILIPLAVLLLIIAVVIAAALLLKNMRGTTFTGGEDTEFPYSWRNDGKGVMTLEIDRGAAGSSTWYAVNNDPADMPVVQTEKQPKKASRFKVTPQDAVRSSLRFLLLDENGEAEAVLDMLMEAGLNDKGVLQTEVIASSLQRRQTARQGGEGTYYPYSIGTDDGLIVVTVSGGAIADDWSVESSNEAAAADAGLFYEDENVILFLAPGSEPGASSIRLFSEKGAVTLKLEAELKENGDFLVTEHSVEGGMSLYEPEEFELEEPESLPEEAGPYEEAETAP